MEYIIRLGELDLTTILKLSDCLGHGQSFWQLNDLNVFYQREGPQDPSAELLVKSIDVWDRWFYQNAVLNVLVRLRMNLRGPQKQAEAEDCFEDGMIEASGHNDVLSGFQFSISFSFHMRAE